MKNLLKTTKNIFNFSLVRRIFQQIDGPYNPLRYKQYINPTTYPKNQQMVQNIQYIHTNPVPNVRNVRHINPIRQSGPLPPYSGTYSMEDIRKMFNNTTIGFHYCQMDVDQVMRRVPGVNFHNRLPENKFNILLNQGQLLNNKLISLILLIILDWMYSICLIKLILLGKQSQILRDKKSYQDLSMLPVGFSPIHDQIDYHWQIFLWGDPPIKATGDLDLSVPNTWFEYQSEFSNDMNICEDQMMIPEEIRRFPTPKNPYCSKELWKSQQKHEEELQMKDVKWKNQLPIKI